MKNPYTISIINPKSFEGQVENSLEQNMNETKLITNWFLSNNTLNLINSYQINGMNLFSALEFKNSLDLENLTLPDSDKARITIGIPTSMDNSGLYDYISQFFVFKDSIELVPVVKSSNAILLDANQGNLRLVITHSPSLEQYYSDRGLFSFSQPFFSSEFSIIGPESDPANIQGLKNASRAFELIELTAKSSNKITFVSRGDFSGTHNKELEIWNTIQKDPIDLNWTSTTNWYISGGSGQSSTFRLTLEKQGYSIIDKPTFFMNQDIQRDNIVEGFSTAIFLILTFDNETWSILLLSFSIHIISILFAISTAIPFAFFSQRYDFLGKDILLIVSNSMMAIPPVVIGLVLWIIFSNSGPLGNLGLLFTSPILILSQFILAFPIIYSISFTGFNSIDPEFYEQLKKFKLSKLTQIKLILNETYSTSLIATISAFSRIIGEVGAMLIIGGNIRWQTRVLTTSIVNELESGVISMAIALGIILVFFAVMFNVILISLQSGNNFISNNTRIKISNYFIKKEIKNISIDENFDFINSFPISEEFFIDLSEIKYSPSKEFELVVPKFQISNNNIIGITGHNSSGKTTFLRVLANDISQDSGSREISNESLEIEYLPQRPLLFKTSLFNNLKYALNNSNESQVTKIAKIIFIAEYFNLKEYFAYPINLLSRGNQNKVAIARSFLMNNVSLYLLDEIFVNLDSESVEKTQLLIKNFKGLNKSFIIVTHNINILNNLVDSNYNFNQGLMNGS